MSKLIRVISMMGLMCMFIILFSGFDHSNYQSILQDLLEKRTNVLEAGYFGEISYQEAATLLKTVEEGDLLEEDLQLLRLSMPTDWDMVEEINIVNLSNPVLQQGDISLKAEIQWTLRGLEMIYAETVAYEFKLKKENENYIISKMEPIE